jgi:ABC-type multidrug transport system fused ATPase/permease subunit
MDVENRAYWLTVASQRWLGLRLDLLGALLTFAVALLVVGTRSSISPSQIGLTLSYIISIQQAFSWLVRQSAEVENNMNSVERIIHYATQIEQEAAYEFKSIEPAEEWPRTGAIEVKDMVFRYRPELPPVIKGISMNIRGGEKIGIVGRTGAGKSTIMTALYRIVELASGTISIDGIDISKLGLTDLRRHLAIIPQDPLLCE